MPKEITHWWLAHEVLEKLRSVGAVEYDAAVDDDASEDDTTGDGGSGAGENGRAWSLVAALEENRNLFFLGAVGPDFLFYYLFGPELKRFLRAAGIMHGSDGSNTLAILASTVEKWGTEVPSGVLAFLFGYACHVAADAVFHPLVLYFAGKGTEDARYNHHLFESVMDLHIYHKFRSVFSSAEITRSSSSVPRELVPLKLQNLTSEMEMSRKDFLDLLGTVSFQGGEYSRKSLARCLSRFEFVQAAFWRPAGQTLARILSRLSPQLRHFGASFYQKEYHALILAFDEVLSYRHPVTGEERQDSILSLRDRMVDQCLEYAAFFEGETGGERVSVGTEDSKTDNRMKNAGGKPDFLENLRRLVGPNLETGIFGDRAEDIRYTDPQGVRGLFGPSAK